MTLGSMQNAEGSIEPAPNKVPDVKTAMDTISADVSSTLAVKFRLFINLFNKEFRRLLSPIF